jgi:AcrR family transcriptional regulator
MTADRARPQGTRKASTRELILDTAERLFAEQGIFATSNRRIAEAAGQGNSSVAGYHFGSKADLVRAITRRFTTEVERSRTQMLAWTTRPDSRSCSAAWCGRGRIASRRSARTRTSPGYAPRR